MRASSPVRSTRPQPPVSHRAVSHRAECRPASRPDGRRGMSARLASAVGGLFVAVAAVGLAFTRLLHGSDWGGPSLNPTWTGRVAVVALIVAGCQVALYAFARARARRQRR